MTIEIDCVSPTRSLIGEGPTWDERDEVLWWTDIPAGIIHRHDPSDGTNSEFRFGHSVGSLAVREKTGLVLATGAGFWLFDPASGEASSISDPEAGLPENRFNDGTTDAAGRFWAGTMKDTHPRQPTGSFYRLDHDHEITCWRSGFWVTNGLAFSPDCRRMYFSETYEDEQGIWSSDYDLDTGSPGEPRLYFDTTRVVGRPDGGTVDAEGCYWFAGVGGWQIHRVSPEGELLLTVELPVEKPTKPMFGGPELDILFVTSIGSGLTPGSEERQPDAGGLFAIKGLGVRGLTQARFAG